MNVSESLRFFSFRITFTGKLSFIQKRRKSNICLFRIRLHTHIHTRVPRGFFRNLADLVNSNEIELYFDASSDVNYLIREVQVFLVSEYERKNTGVRFRKRRFHFLKTTNRRHVRRGRHAGILTNSPAVRRNSVFAAPFSKSGRRAITLSAVFAFFQAVSYSRNETLTRVARNNIAAQYRVTGACRRTAVPTTALCNILNVRTSTRNLFRSLSGDMNG